MKGRQGWSRIVALTVLIHVLVATSAGARAFGLSVMFVQQDTTRPPVPPLPNLPSDSTFTVESPRYPRSQLLYYRNILRISFDDSTSGATIRNLFKRYSATVIGGIPGPVEPEYLLQVPDPGATLEALDSLLNQLNQEPGVRWAASVYYRTPGSIYWRHPNSSGSNSVFSPWSGIVQDYGTLSVISQQRPRVPLTAPDTVPAWVYAPENLASDTGASYEYYADVIIVGFTPDATQADRQAAIDAVNGIVIGGEPMTQGEGFYYVRLNAARRLEPLALAVRLLWSRPRVAVVSLVTPLEEQYRRPEDQGDFAVWDGHRKKRVIIKVLGE